MSDRNYSADIKEATFFDVCIMGCSVLILVSFSTKWPLFMGRRTQMLTFSETWHIVKLLECFMKLRCFDLSSRLTRCPADKLNT